ncbi:hypothetical protein WN48_06500 [Eufriesea mexicana]|uniref:Uncharacterized protein n=1 Tax=Eufriesea mexicana TaxID=516756 RepID=A0A310SJQ5_9HYME|nr:hypothetical protein WN48_06500 [Eufriesea mexicana]
MGIICHGTWEFAATPCSSRNRIEKDVWRREEAKKERGGETLVPRKCFSRVKASGFVCMYSSSTQHLETPPATYRQRATRGSVRLLGIVTT